MLYEVITNEHDMLTGTQDDGTAYFPDEADHTCNNWTSSDAGSAQVGHHDRHGGGNLSWNSAHRITSYNVCYTKLLRNRFRLSSNRLWAFLRSL